MVIFRSNTNKIAHAQKFMQTNQHHAKCTSNRCYLIIFVTCWAKLSFWEEERTRSRWENNQRKRERHSERSEKKNQNTVFSIAQTYAQFKLKTSKNHNGIINKKLSESKSTNLKGKTHLKFWPLWYGWRTSVRSVRPPVRGSLLKMVFLSI